MQKIELKKVLKKVLSLFNVPIKVPKKCFSSKKCKKEHFKKHFCRTGTLMSKRVKLLDLGFAYLLEFSFSSLFSWKITWMGLLQTPKFWARKKQTWPPPVTSEVPTSLDPGQWGSGTPPASARSCFWNVDISSRVPPCSTWPVLLVLPPLAF